MDYTDFLKNPEPTEVEPAASEKEAVPEIIADENIDVQKAVVEELAAEKVAMELKLDELTKKVAALEAEKASLVEASGKLKEENAALSAALLANRETTTSSQIALLDRNFELPDRFIGETREHVINAIKVALEEARENGRIRRAQLLESVLVVNESTGEIEKKRAALEKFFADHQNIFDGEVIAKLKEYGIAHKEGETYLLPSEVIKRTY